MAGLGSALGATPTGGAQSQDPAVPVERPTSDGKLVASGPQGGEMEDASPEEQAQYDQFVQNGLELLDGQAQQGVLDALKASDDPKMNLATAASSFIKGLVTSAAKAGMQIEDSVLYAGGKELFEHIADMAEAAGTHDYTEEELEGAWYLGLDLYREQATADGTIDAEALKAQWNEVVDADRAGTLGDLVPGYKAKGKAAEDADADEAREA